MLQATPTQAVIYGAVNQQVLSRISLKAGRVLGIGCDSGELGKQIKQNINCEVEGVTYSELELELALKG